MGTFHDDKGELHGVTVIVDTRGPLVYVGQCDTVDESGVKLQDVDVHEDGQDGRSKAEYLERAKKFGTWTKHARFAIPSSDIKSIQMLSAYEASEQASAAQAGAARTSAAQPPPRPESAAKQSPVAATQNEIVALTDSAVVEVKRLLADPENDGNGLRLRVVGGGCSGLVYHLEFDKRKDNDLVGEHEGFSVFIDRKSAVYLRGVMLDHQSGLSGKGFIFHNPNASNTCGCGESFSI